MTNALPESPADLSGIQITNADHRAETASERTVRASDFAPPRQGIFSTLTDRTGQPVSNRQMQGDDLITYTGASGRPFQMSLSAAERAGLVVKTEDGSYREITDADRIEAQKVEQQNQAKDADPLANTRVDADTERSIQTFASLCQSAKINPISVASEWLAAPDRVPQSLELACRQTGVPVADAMKQFQAIGASLKSQAEKLFVEMGFHPEDLWRHEQLTTSTHQRHQAYLRHLMFGDMRYYRELAKHYAMTHGAGRGSGEAVGAGLPSNASIKRTSLGREYVEIAGLPPMSVATAKRMRLI